MSSPGNRSLPLTIEERRALSFSARGLGVTEVAEAMGTSSAVVRVWLATGIDKLGAHSKLEAVVIAARRGDLNLPR
jgi:DNA-binding NarL/FixJ family response regulator